MEQEERLLWQGAPEPGMKPFVGVLGVSVFGVPFLLAGIFIIAEGIDALLDQRGIWAIGLGVFYLAFAVPFLLAGLTMTLGAWIAYAYAHKYIKYALSDRRAYIARSFLGHSIDSHIIGKNDPVTLTQGRCDTVSFTTLHSHDSDGDKITRTVGFDWIRDGHEVYQLIRQIQRDAQ